MLSRLSSRIAPVRVERGGVARETWRRDRSEPSLALRLGGSGTEAMIKDLDATILQLLKTSAPAGSSLVGATISFDLPDADWRATLTGLTVNCYLYDVHENLAMRTHEPLLVRSGQDGVAHRAAGSHRLRVLHHGLEPRHHRRRARGARPAQPGAHGAPAEPDHPRRRSCKECWWARSLPHRHRLGRRHRQESPAVLDRPRSEAQAVSQLHRHPGHDARPCPRGRPHSVRIRGRSPRDSRAPHRLPCSGAAPSRGPVFTITEK